MLSPSLFINFLIIILILKLLHSFKNFFFNYVLAFIFIIFIKHNNVSLLNYIINNITDLNYNLFYYIIIIIIIYKLKYKYYMHSAEFLFMNLFIIFILLYYDYTTANINYYNNIFFIKKNTETLSNGLFFIHPIILYVSYSIYLLYFILCRETSHIKKKQYIYFFLFFTGAVSLGGWWASQELNWGGWWSWDFVEFLSLLILLKVILQIHKWTPAKTNVFRLRTLFFFILILYSPRSGIINSVHAFISSIPIDNFFFFVLSLIYVKISLYYLKKTKNSFFFWFFWFFILILYYLNFFFF